MRKLVLLFILIFSVCFTFASCANSHYDDMNGAFDTSLSIITTDNICDESYWAWLASGEKDIREKQSSGAENAELDCDYIEYSSLKASGIRSVMDTYIAQDEAWLFTVYMRVNGGNARLYMLSCDNEILYEFEIDEDDGFILNGMPVGEYTLVLACESADIELMAGRKKM